MANIEGLNALPRLMALLASRTGGLLNQSDISRDSGLSYTTLHRYLTLLEAIFLVQMLPAWYANIGLRLAKGPKGTLCDTGLAAALLGLGAERLQSDGGPLGRFLETFVSMEIQKLASWSRVQPQMFHWCTQAQQEVDLLLENASGQIVGIEVKASATVTADDFKGLRLLSDAVGSRFAQGVVIYTGGQVVPFGERLHALPISALWTEGAAQ